MTRVPTNRYVIFAAIAVLGVIADLYSKHIVFAKLGYPGGSSRLLIDGWLSFRLYTSFNEGALWGVGQGYARIFAGLSVVAILGICYWLFFRGAALSAWLTVSLGFIMAGTLGNLYDRIGWHGCVNPANGETLYAVRDFLLFTFGQFHWPVFNFADVFLVTGAIMLVLQSIYAEFQAARQPGDAPASTTASSASDDLPIAAAS